MASFRRKFAKAIGASSAGRRLLQIDRKKATPPAGPGTFSDLLSKAQGAIPQATQFLQAQIGAQRGLFPGFEPARQAELGAIGRLTEQVFAQAPERQIGVQQVRAAQAARGIALSGQAALQEGLQVSAQQVGFERRNIDLFGRARALQSATPLGLQVPDIFGGVSRQQGLRQQFGQNLFAQAEQRSDAKELERRALLLKAGTALVGGFAGAAGFLGQGVGFGGGLFAGITGTAPRPSSFTQGPAFGAVQGGLAGGGGAIETTGGANAELLSLIQQGGIGNALEQQFNV